MRHSVQQLLKMTALFVALATGLQLTATDGIAQGRGVIAVEPLAYDFGDVAIGATSTQEFSMRNDGTADLLLYVMAVVGKDASAFSLGGNHDRLMNLAPREVRGVELSFTPTAEGPQSAILRIVSNALNESLLEIQLRGNGVPMASLGYASAAAVPNNDSPAPNEDISVAITIDMTGLKPPAEVLTFYRATLNWDAAVLKYNGFDPGNQPWDNPAAVSVSDVNNGHLEWIDLDFTGGASGTFTVVNFKFKVIGVPGSGTVLDLEFLRMAGDEFEAIHQLTTVTDGTIQVKNTGIAPDLAVDVPAQDFGTVTVGSSAVRNFVVTNEGATDLTVAEMTFVGTNPKQFSIIKYSAPFNLATGERRNVTVRFKPTFAGAKSAALRIISNDPDENPLDLPLTGNAISTPVPNIALDLTSHHYGIVEVGATSSQTFVVTNTGDAALVVTNLNMLAAVGTEANQFTVVSGDAPFTVAPGANHNLVIQFAPTSEGVKSVTARLSNNDPDQNTLDLALTGVGIRKPKVAVYPGAHDFGRLEVGSTAAQSFVVTNEGTSSLLVVAMGLEDDDPEDQFWFSISSLRQGPYALAPGESREVVVNFIPTSTGPKTGKLVILTNEQEKISVEVPLTGTGFAVPQVMVLPASHDYGAFTIGSSSSLKMLVINSSLGDLVVDGMGLVGADASQFSIASGGNAPFTLGPAEIREVMINFLATSQGPKNAALRILSNDPAQRPLDVPLAGKGVLRRVPDIVLTPTVYNYGTVAIDSSASQRFVVRNQGTSNLTVSATTLVGTNTDQFSIDSGGAPFALAPGDSHNIIVSYRPTSEGRKTAALQIESDDPDEGLVKASLLGTVPLSPFVAVKLPQNAIGAPGTSVTIPIKVGNLSYRQVIGYRAIIAYDKNVLSASGASSVGTLSETWGAPNVSTVADGKIYVGGLGSSPLVGSGTLVNLHFNVVGQAGNISDLVFVKFVFNLGNFPAAITDNGQFTVQNLTQPDINVDSYTVEYGIVMPGTTASQTLTVSNRGSRNLVVNATNLLTAVPDQFTIVSGEAPFILAPGASRNLVVNCSPISSDPQFAKLFFVSNDPDENPLCVLLANNNKVPVPPAIPVEIPEDLLGAPGMTVNVPINVGDLTGRNVSLFGALLFFDETILRPKGVSTVGTLTQNFGRAHLLPLAPDLIGVGVATNTVLSGSGTLINVQFDVLGLPGDKTPLIIVQSMFNRGNPPAVADNGKLTVQEFVFLADKAVKILGNKSSEGSIYSNGKITMEKGLPGTHAGGLIAKDDITIRGNNVIMGGAFAGDDLYLFGNSTVNGTKAHHLKAIRAINLPTPSFTAQGPNITVPQSGRLRLVPGSYGKVKVLTKGTLVLSTGDYFINILDTDPSAILTIDVSAGPVNINVVSQLDIDTGVKMHITPSGIWGTTLVTITTLQKPKVVLGQGARVLGSILAPYAEVYFSQNCSFKGFVGADKINVSPGVPFLPHSSMTLLKEAPSEEGNETEETITPVVTTYELAQNYPNPFNPNTTIGFALPEPGKVTLRIFTESGQLVRTLIDREMESGRHELRWNGRNQSGIPVATGIYFYQMVVTNKNGEKAFTQTCRMTLVK